MTLSVLDILYFLALVQRFRTIKITVCTSDLSSSVQLHAGQHAERKVLLVRTHRGGLGAAGVEEVKAPS